MKDLAALQIRADVHTQVDDPWFASIKTVF